MKKLLQINTVVNYGSTGHIVESIGEEVLRHGWESYVIYGRKPRDSKSRLIRIGNAVSILWHYIQREFFDRSALASTKATKRLLKKIDEINPDIIHLHNLHGCYLNIKVLFEYFAQREFQIIFTLHDCWSMTGHCGHFTALGCDKWKTGCFDCPQIRNEKFWPLVLDRSKYNYNLKRELFANIENLTLVPVSYWLERVVKESFLKEKNTYVICNGIDTVVFTPQKNLDKIRQKYNIPPKLILLGVANVWENKGLDDFLLLNEKITDDVVIVLVGLSKKQINRLPAKIIGIERTESKEELAQLYSLADLFINPSVEETFGLTTVEAMACGTPVVVYNSTASPVLVTTETGFVVSPHDIEGIKRCVDIICEKGKDIYNLTCRQRVLRYFDKDKQNKMYYSLYCDLIQSQ